MTDHTHTETQARIDLYDTMRADIDFETKVERALALAKDYLDVENAHLTRIEPDADYWEAIASTDPEDGEFPPGLVLDYNTTYCRRVLANGGSVALHDAPDQGWANDAAFEEHELHCYHGTAIHVDGEPYGTVCFVSEQPRERPFDQDDTLFAELVARMLEHELERRRHEADTTRRSNSITVLSRVLRHNLRNEMTVVRGRVGALADQLDAESPVSDAVFDSIDRVIALSDKARKLETVVSTDYDRELVALAPLLDRITTAVSLDHPDATITTDVPDGLAVDLMASFELAVTELVENAATHAGPEAQIAVSVEETPGGITLHVADDGPGLPAQEQAVLADGVETPLVHGSGLGLWMVYWIVATHDGTISATTTDSGTTVTVRVPRVTTADKIPSESDVQALQQGRDRFEAVFEEGFDAMVLVDDQRRIIDANKHAAELFGLPQPDLLGRPLDAFVGDGFDLDGAWQALQGAGTHAGECPIHEPAGPDRTVEYTAAADVIPGQHLLIGRDITERKQRERELHRYEATIEASPDPIVVLDTDGVIEVWNEAAERVFGYGQEEAVGTPVSQLLVPAETDRAAFSERFQRALAGEQFKGLEVTREAKDGTSVEVRISTAAVRDSDGTVTGLVAVATDISDIKDREAALRQTNRQLETVLESVDAAIFIKDTEGRYQVMNGECRQLLGMDAEEAVEGLTDEELFPAETAAQFRADDRRVIESGETIEREEEVPTKDGRRTHLTVKSPVYDGDGEIQGVCAVSTDITDRVAAEKAQAENERLEEFARVLSHDLRNPLNVAEGRLALAREEADSEHLVEVERALGRMDVLIEDALAVAHDRAREVEWTEIRVAEIVEGCWGNVETKEATLVVEIDRVVVGDERRVKQVFENLIRNSVEHGGSDVTVRVGELADGFFVEDDGCGIPVGEREEVFEMGYSTAAEGTGFGLSIVSKMVEAHGWEIRLTEGDGGGARFEIRGVEWGGG